MEHRRAFSAALDEATRVGIQIGKAKSCKKRWELLLKKREAAVIARAEARWIAPGNPSNSLENMAIGLQLSAEVGLTQMARFGCRGGHALVGKKFW